MTTINKILIIEDEEILAENLRDYFTKRAIDARIAPSGEAALGMATQFQPDLLVLDYGLPGMDGLQTFGMLKGLELHFACVLITGHPTEAVFEAAHQIGIRHILVKPFSFSDLQGVIAGQPDVMSGEGGDEERRASSTRRAAERRQLNGSAAFPLNTGDGWVKDERRRSERRSVADRRLTGFAPASTLIS
jgi:DNA-binding response OmpR family regulator